jgi:hypothetical protein
MTEAPLTTEQSFIVNRLRTKVGAAKHQIVDAAKAAAALSPELLARCGMREAVAVLEQELAVLHACVQAREPTPEGTSG